MRFLGLISFLLAANFVIAQETFYDVYNSILKLHGNYAATKKGTFVDGTGDSLELKEQDSPEFLRLYADITTVSKRVVNLGFPDIMFTDVHESPYNISDFEGELVVNYNYPYCMKCISRIDSTQKRTDKKKIKVLVLFLDIYKKEISFLKPFNEQVLIGFISPDARDLISLTLGSDCMYFLDVNHRIEFFDRGNDEKWTDFLDQKLK